MIEDLAISEARFSDSAFVLGNWCSSWERSQWSGTIPYGRVFKETHLPFLAKLANRENVQVLMAHNPEDRDHLYGFLVHEMNYKSPIVHFTYVKSIYRKMGIASALLKEANINPHRFFYYTHRTQDVADIGRQRLSLKKPFKGSWYPALARKQKGNHESTDRSVRERNQLALSADRDVDRHEESSSGEVVQV